MKSIISDSDKCYICGARATEEHHIFFGNPGRKNSEKYGLKVPLCHWCHTEPPFGVHFNAELDKQLKVVGQTMFERHNPDASFREIFGKSYK